MTFSPPAKAAAPAAGAPLSVAGVDPERNFAGGETQVLGLTLELRAMGHRAELLCDPAGELWRRAQAAGVVCHPLAIRNALDLAGAAALRRRLRDGRYDVVHFHTSRAHAMAPWVRGLTRAAVVTRRMDYVPNRLFARWLYGRRAVDGVAAISAAVADALVRAGVARARITLVPSGVDCAHFRPPSADERAQARAFLDDQARYFAAHAAAARSRPSPAPDGDDPARAAAWVDFALAMLNRNEFVYVP